MSDIYVKKPNESVCNIICSRGIAQELREYFSFLMPGAKYHPKVKQKLWDGILRLCKILPNGKCELPFGLVSQLLKFADSHGYTISLDYDTEHVNVPESDIIHYINSLDIHSGGVKINVRNYQIDSIINCILHRRKVLLSPTSSGKSLILYGIIRYLLDNNHSKGLIIVPNVSLCNQLFSDFDDYSSNIKWYVGDNVHKIFSGQDKESDKAIYLSTWQTLQNIKDPSYFEKFEFVLNDECHLASAAQISNIVNQCVNAKYKIGMTGTLNGTKVHSLQLEGLFGEILQVTTTKELMDTKQVVALSIKNIVLRYPEDTRILTNKLKYKEEIDFLISNTKRNNFIKKLALSMTGNVLLLYQYVENHGEVLYKLISESKHAENKIIYLIHGNTKADERERIRKLVETQDNVILIGSVGTIDRKSVV